MQIIVLSPHRCGSSACTRLINMMGAYAGEPESIKPPNPENRKGFWENDEVVDLNKLILHRLGGRWDRVSGINPELLKSPKLDVMRRPAEKLVARLDAFRPWVAKDPRMCVLMPFWRPLLEVPVCVFVYRHPVEVARSLERRNRIPMEAGLALWEKHMVAALADTMELPRIVVLYSDLLRAPVETSVGLFEDLQAAGVTGLRLPARREIESFIDPTLHRERVQEDEIHLLSESQARLQTAFESREIADIALPIFSEDALAVLQRYERQTTPDPEPLLAASRWNMGEVIRIRTQLQKTERVLNTKEKQNSALAEKIQLTQDHHEELTKCIKSMGRQNQVSKEHIATLQELNDRLRQEGMALQGQRERLEGELADLTALLNASKQAQAQIENKCMELQSAYEELSKSHTQLEEQCTVLKSENTETKKAHAEMEKQNIKYIRQIDQHKTQLERALSISKTEHQELRRKHSSVTTDYWTQKRALKCASRVITQLHDNISEIDANVWWRLGVRLRLFAGSLGLKKLRPRFPTDRGREAYQEWMLRNELQAQDAKKAPPHPAATNRASNATAEERKAYQQDLSTLSGWIDVLEESIESMHALWWWQVGLKLRSAASLMRLRSRHPKMPYDESVRLMKQWQELQTDMFRKASEPSASRQELEQQLAEAKRVLLYFNDNVTRMRINSWWRLGIWGRTSVGRLGLMKKNFQMPTDFTDEILTKFHEWKPRLETVQQPKFTMPMRRPGAKLAKVRSADSNDSPKIDATRKSVCINGVYNSSVSTLLGVIKNPSVHSAVEASESLLAELKPEAYDEPLVSIIMATFNRAHIMGEAIQSIREQTWQNWELIVCDDGSEDNTEELVFDIRDARIRYLQLPHGGAAKARNEGLVHAQGEFIAYLDTDNLWHPRYLEVMISNLLQRTGHFTAYAKYLDVVIEDNDRLRLKSYASREFNFERLYEKNFIDLNTFVHRATLLRKFSGFTEELPRCQDWDLVLKYTFLRDPIYVDAYLAFYRRNKSWDQLTSKIKKFGETPNTIVHRNLASYFANGLPHIQTDKRKRKITVLSWDICRNHFSKAYNVAEALHRSSDIEVQLVGFRFFEEEIFPPYAAEKPPFATHYFEGKDFPDFEKNFAKAITTADSDLIYCVKPRMPSLGTALMANYHFGVPIVLESNDFEATVARPLHGDESAAIGLNEVNLQDPELHCPYSGTWSRIMDACAHELPFIVTHNKNLDAHYGNRCFYIRNLKDEHHYDPALYDRRKIREELGFRPDDKIVLFGGLLRKHKGIFDIVELIESLGGTPYKALFVGSRVSPDQERLAREFGSNVTILPPQDRNHMAQINFASDVVILWLNPRVSASHYQMPYKLTDALAMKVPVIANDISDLGDLGRQGYLRLVEYGDREALCEAVRDLTVPSEERERMVEAGRRLYLRQFSYKATLANFELISDLAMRKQAIIPVAERFAEFYSKFHQELCSSQKPTEAKSAH